MCWQDHRASSSLTLKDVPHLSSRLAIHSRCRLVQNYELHNMCNCSSPLIKHRFRHGHLPLAVVLRTQPMLDPQVSIRVFLSFNCGKSTSSQLTKNRVSEWRSTSHSTHNWSFRGRVFTSNQLHWYWQPNSPQPRENTHKIRGVEKESKLESPESGFLDLSRSFAEDSDSGNFLLLDCTLSTLSLVLLCLHATVHLLLEVCRI